MVLSYDAGKHTRVIDSHPEIWVDWKGNVLDHQNRNQPKLSISMAVFLGGSLYMSTGVFLGGGGSCPLAERRFLGGGSWGVRKWPSPLECILPTPSDVFLQLFASRIIDRNYTNNGLPFVQYSGSLNFLKLLPNETQIQIVNFNT